MSEIAISQAEVDLALRNLRSWMKDEKVSKNLVNWRRGRGRVVGGLWELLVPIVRLHRASLLTPDPGYTAGLSLHPEGALRSGAHHRALELSH